MAEQPPEQPSEAMTALERLLAPVGWWVGIDSGWKEHQVCLLDRHGRVKGQRSFAHSGPGVAELCAWLLEQTAAPPAQIAVAIEVPHGAVVETLLERGFLVFAINPKQLDRFRDRFSVAGAKDDTRDAYVLADSLRTDAHCFRHLARDHPLVLELREASRLAEELTQDRMRFINRLRDQLRRYHPQILELADDLGAEWILALLTLAPTPAKAARLRQDRIASLLKAHHVRRLDATGVVAILRQPALHVAPGVTEGISATVATLIARIRLVSRQLRQSERQLATLCDKLAAEAPVGQAGEQNDVAILDSLPGIGPIVLAILLAEAHRLLQRRDYQALRLLSGIAPVTLQSGRKRQVVMRYACNERLRNALYHWARTAMQKDPLCRAHYHRLRADGHSHGRALRGIADRLLRIACAMLTNRSLYDPHHHAKQALAA
jgi:hypothetical protein